MRAVYGRTIRSRVLWLLAYAAAYAVDFYAEASYSQFYKSLVFDDYQSPSLVKTLNQMVEKEEVRQIGAGLMLGDKGEELIEELWPLLKFKGQKWDRKWRLVIFDLPEKRRHLRDRLRLLLLQIGFGKWQRSIYVTPFDVMSRVNAFLAEEGLEKMVVCLEAEQLGVADVKGFSEKVFMLKDKAEMARRLIKDGSTLLAKTNLEKVGMWLDDVVEFETEAPPYPDELVGSEWKRLVRQIDRLKRRAVGIAVKKGS